MASTSTATSATTQGPSSLDGAAAITREQLIELLNEDLAREYQAIIAYVVYSQVLKGPQYMKIAEELETHASEELAARADDLPADRLSGRHAGRRTQAGEDLGRCPRDAPF